MKNLTYSPTVAAAIVLIFAADKGARRIDKAAGVDFIQLPVANVLQPDKLDDTQFVMLQRRANDDLDLCTTGERFL